MHSSRVSTSSKPYDSLYDTILFTQILPNNKVNRILDEIIRTATTRIHNKYLFSQINRYASQTMARELVLTSSLASPHVCMPVPFAEPDEDLEMPGIDEWAAGVLPIRPPDAPSLRSAVAPGRDSLTKPLQSRVRIAQQPSLPSQVQDKTVSPNSRSTGRSHKALQSGRESQKRRSKPHVSDAELVSRAFEEAKKKTGMAMKSVTVDSDFSVIQINEPKNLPPALIIPKISSKKSANTTSEKVRSVVKRQPTANVKRTNLRRKGQPKLLTPEMPTFDLEVSEISYTDKFIAAPGVILRDGSLTKSRAPVANPSQMTRQQYEMLLDDIKANK